MKEEGLGLMGKSLFKSLLGKECLGSLLGKGRRFRVDDSSEI